DQQKAIDGSKDADLTFSHQVSDGSVKAFKAADGGALVTVNLVYNVTAKPKEDGASISVSKDSAVFTGGATTTTGFERTSTESVLLFIPAAGSKTPLTLLAANQGITGAAFK
ncbi:MAG: hypothetical protein HIU81_11295, partial [Acidobacteria bacterium]|nr:hypothetical protein [Acidobacteriota bacterium]